MADIPQLLDQIQRLCAILIDVATGQMRIQEGEAEYTKRRAEVSDDLKSLRVNDPNSFPSLWDWYGYWKANGLTSYQSRRDYVSGLYCPALASGYKSHRFNWLENRVDFSRESSSWKACKMGTCSKSVRLRTCRIS